MSTISPKYFQNTAEAETTIENVVGENVGIKKNDQSRELLHSHVMIFFSGWSLKTPRNSNT